jgi:hypothetical protein
MQAQQRGVRFDIAAPQRDIVAGKDRHMKNTIAGRKNCLRKRLDVVHVEP